MAIVYNFSITIFYIPFFLDRSASLDLPITDPNMTRFNISLKDGVNMVFWALANSLGGELFVPKLPSYRITDLAQAICPDAKLTVIGMRPGEKLHEEMITSSDSYSTIDLGKYYAILPSDGHLLNRYVDEGRSFKKVTPGFSYSSDSNSHFLTIGEIRQLIRDHVDSNFSLA